jgi:hypothetical protein
VKTCFFLRAFGCFIKQKMCSPSPEQQHIMAQPSWIPCLSGISSPSQFDALAVPRWQCLLVAPVNVSGLAVGFNREREREGLQKKEGGGGIFVKLDSVTKKHK